MTDDEAFIRAVVAAPGDDAPRLVYADWLDERGDPRGEYLRAELAWANAPSDAAATNLQKLGKAIEPVWVNRVSRTPLGACCDHLRFRESGPVLTEDIGRQVVRQAGLPLVPAHLAFLLNYNGGIPEPKYFPRRGRHETELDEPERFFALVPEGDRFCPIDMRHYADPDSAGRSKFDVRFAAYWFQFGNGQLHGELTFQPLSKVRTLGMIALGLTGARRGKVYQFNRDILAQCQPPILVTKSLTEFLNSIRPIESFSDYYGRPE